MSGRQRAFWVSVIVIVWAFGLGALMWFASQPDTGQQHKVDNCLERGGYVQTGYYGQFTGCIYGRQP